MTYYMETFKDSEIIRFTRCGVGEQGKEGEVSQSAFFIRWRFINTAGQLSNQQKVRMGSR